MYRIRDCAWSGPGGEAGRLPLETREIAVIILINNINPSHAPKPPSELETKRKRKRRGCNLDWREGERGWGRDQAGSQPNWAAHHSAHNSGCDPFLIRIK